MKGHSYQNQGIQTCDDEIAKLKGLMPPSWITVQQKSYIDKRYSVDSDLVKVVALGDVRFFRTVEGQDEVVWLEVCDIRLRITVGFIGNNGVRFVDGDGAVVVEDDAISKGVVDDIEISVLAIEQSLVDSLVVEVTDFPIFDH